MGLRAGHGVRATYIGMHLANSLGLSEPEKVDLFYAELLMDAGCTAWASQTAAAILGDDSAARNALFFDTDPDDPRDMLRWLAGYMATGERLDRRLKRSIMFVPTARDFMLEGLRNTAETAARLARRLGRSPGTQTALRYVFEQWSGGGPHALCADDIPLVSRIVYATIFVEVLHQIGGRDAAIRLATGRRGKTLDPSVVDAFLDLAEQPEFWSGLEDDAVPTLVRQLEPDSQYRYVSADHIDEAAMAFADFADLKSMYSAGHSRRVARLSEQIATDLDLATESVITIRRASLVHDLGLVVVPAFVLHKPVDRLAVAERESLRLHPYHSERILAGVPAFLELCTLVVAHHEQPDGRGFPRGMRGEQIPIGARVIAVADAFDELTHARPDGPAMDVQSALSELQRDSNTRFDVEVLEALRRLLHVPAQTPLPPATAPRREWPANLTDREVEVLRLLATGASRRDIAHRLSVSEHTVRHHLEHIYAKLQVRTRVEATLFALEHDLIA